MHVVEWVYTQTQEWFDLYHDRITSLNFKHCNPYITELPPTAIADIVTSSDDDDDGGSGNGNGSGNGSGSGSGSGNGNEKKMKKPYYHSSRDGVLLIKDKYEKTVLHLAVQAVGKCSVV